MYIFSLVLLFTLTLSSCANLNSIHRSTDINNTKIDFIDAKQRAVLRVGLGKRGKPETIICTEPSPDVFSVLSSNFDANASKGDIQAGFSAAIAEGASTIGIRTASIQLLRDAMYRTCEAYAAGALEATEYARLTKRYQKSMVTLLAIEQLTNTVYPPTVSLTSTSSNEYSKQIFEATKTKIATENMLAQLKKDLLEAEMKKSSATMTITIDIERTKENLKLLGNALNKLKKPSLDVAVKSTISPNTRTVLPVDIKAVAGTIKEMLKDVYRTDVIELCFQTDLLDKLNKRAEHEIMVENKLKKLFPNKKISKIKVSNNRIQVFSAANSEEITLPVLTKEEEEEKQQLIEQLIKLKEDNNAANAVIDRYNEQTTWCESIVGKI